MTVLTLNLDGLMLKLMACILKMMDLQRLPVAAKSGAELGELGELDLRMQKEHVSA